MFSIFLLVCSCLCDVLQLFVWCFVVVCVMFCSCLCDVLCLSTFSSFDMCWFGSVCTRKFFGSVIVNGFCMYLRFPVH